MSFTDGAYNAIEKTVELAKAGVSINPELISAIIYLIPTHIMYFQNASDEIKMAAIKRDPRSILNLKSPSEDMLQLAVSEDAYIFKELIIERQIKMSEAVVNAAIHKNPNNIGYISKPNKSQQLIAVFATTIHYNKNKKSLCCGSVKSC